MADLPPEEANSLPKPVVTDQIKVTHENADVLAVHFLSKIYGRLGYLIKLLEEKPRG